MCFEFAVFLFYDAWAWYLGSEIIEHMHRQNTNLLFPVVYKYLMNVTNIMTEYLNQLNKLITLINSQMFQYAMHQCTKETHVETTHNMSVNLHKNDHSIS